MDDYPRVKAIDSLPLLGSMHFPEDEPSKPAQATKRRCALGPILVSTLLHALGLYALVEHRIETPKQANAERIAITIQLVQPPQSPAPALAPVLPTTTEGVVENTSSVSRPVQAPALPPPRVDLAQQPETALTIAPTPPLPAPEALAPTRLSIRQLVEQLRVEEEQRAVLQVCTPVQKRNPMLLCGDEADSALANAQREVDNAYFAATLQSNDDVASAARVRRIVSSLHESGMSQDDIDRYIQAIDVNSQQRRTSGDARASAVRDQMFRNDSTYQQMQRALNP